MNNQAHHYSVVVQVSWRVMRVPVVVPREGFGRKA